MSPAIRLAAGARKRGRCGSDTSLRGLRGEADGASLPRRQPSFVGHGYTALVPVLRPYTTPTLPTRGRRGTCMAQLLRGRKDMFCVRRQPRKSALLDGL